jgi:hypothetical protein
VEGLSTDGVGTATLAVLPLCAVLVVPRYKLDTQRQAESNRDYFCDNLCVQVVSLHRQTHSLTK